MEPITFALLMMGATFATKSIQGYYQRKENRKNQTEASNLAQQQRQDDLQYEQQNIGLSNRQLSLDNQKNEFDNRMINGNIQDKNKEKAYEVNKASNASFLNIANNMGFDKNSFLYKSRILGSV
jgi:hypothetical protein